MTSPDHTTHMNIPSHEDSRLTDDDNHMKPQHTHRMLVQTDILQSKIGLALREFRIHLPNKDSVRDPNIGENCQIAPVRQDDSAPGSVDMLLGVLSISEGWPIDVYNILHPDQPGPGRKTAILPASFDTVTCQVLLPQCFIPTASVKGNALLLENVLRWKANRRPWQKRIRVSVELEYQVFALETPWGNHDVVRYDQPEHSHVEG